MSAKLEKWFPDEHMRTKGFPGRSGDLTSGVVQQIPIVNISLSGTHNLPTLRTICSQFMTSTLWSD